MSLILDRVVNVSRLQRDSDNTNKESYVSYLPLQNISINIQPAQAEDVLQAGVVFGQAYTAFTTASGILSGDKLTDVKLGEVFMVKGRQNWMSPSLIQHIELLLVKFETTE